MGISLYLIVSKKDVDVKIPVTIFAIQLVMNFCWSPIFFIYGQYLLAFIWIVILWILVLAMVLTFRKIDAKAGYLQIPYLLWLIIAGYLSCSVYLLN
jgi:tryptophan-rich sensory protein